MESLQQQILELRQQVSSLSQVMETIPQQVLAAIANNAPAPIADIELANSLDDLEHKDVLTDKPHQSWSSFVDEKEISSEWQIRRLTAQLTIAYNRIAVLEEELLDRRMSIHRAS
jgi:hypothetical protein